MNTCAPVMIHARGQQTHDECTLWNRLSDALQTRGSSLAIIAHHNPKSPVNFEMRRISNGLSSAPVTPACPLPHERIGRWSTDALLERERFWRGAETAQPSIRRQAIAYYESAYSRSLDEWHPSLVVIWNGHHPQEIVLNELCVARGVPVVWLERGPLPATVQFDTQGVLAGSSIAQQDDWKWDTPSEQARWHSAFDSYRDALGTGTWWPQPDSLGAAHLRSRIGVKQNETTVCFAAQVDRDVQNLHYAPLFDANTQAFQWLCAHLTIALRSTFLLGKHHPKSNAPASAYENVLKEWYTYTNRGIWLADTSIGDCIDLCDRFAAVNSTSIFEAILAGRPTLQLGRSLLTGKGIAYEIASLDDPTRQVNAWLDATDWDTRFTRFNDFCSYLLARHLYATSEAQEHLGLNGVDALADQLLEWASARDLSGEYV